jgi:hypothetical protein
MARRSSSGTFWASYFVGVLILSAGLQSWFLAVILILFAVVLWLAFDKWTLCDVEKTDGQPCGNRVRGKLRACPWHGRQKRDAIWAYLGLTNPGQQYRIMWARATGQPANITPAPAAATPQVLNPLYHAVILIATVAGPLIAVAALVVQVAVT